MRLKSVSSCFCGSWCDQDYVYVTWHASIALSLVELSLTPLGERSEDETVIDYQWLGKA